MKSFLLSVILFFCLPPTHAQTTLDNEPNLIYS